MRSDRLYRWEGGVALDAARPALRLLAAALLASAWAGCRSTPTAGPTAAEPPVWPPLPATPRIRYVQSVSVPEDLGIRPSFWAGIGRLVTGANRAERALIKPLGVAFDEAGNLCVADPGSASISFYDTRRLSYRRWDHIGKVTFISPLAVAKAGDFLFVADSGLRKVIGFDIGGKLRFESGAELKRPAGLAVAGDSLLVADAEAHAILVYDLQGRLRSRFGRRGKGPGEFNFPTHIAADSQGRIYVTDAMNSRVQMLDREGGFLREIGGIGDNSGHFSRPKGVAVDASGNVYVADALFDNVQAFDRDGRFLLHWGEAGSDPGEFWLPGGVAVDRERKIAVADSFNRRVQIFEYIGER